MSVDLADFSEFTPASPEVAEAAPPAGSTLAPETPGELARVLDTASANRAVVLPWGGGTHQGIGYRVYPDVVVSTANLVEVIAWEPDDLTLVVEAGVRVDEIEVMLAARGQTAGLPEKAPGATVGGVIAAGVSGYRRARIGPTRDRVLEVTLATGDGRVVKGGGRVVKNVSGYDLPRFAAGSLGALGVIASVCLKLWPVPEAQATLRVDDATRAWRTLFRPLAVLETHDGAFAYVEGRRAQVEVQARQIGAEPVEGLRWPETPEGAVGYAVSVPPADLASAVSRLPDGSRYVAQHGVGRVDVAADLDTSDGIADLRGWAEDRGGRVIITWGPEDLYENLDPWGTPPPGLELQRRLIAAFDPLRVVNRGRLPGGL